MFHGLLIFVAGLAILIFTSLFNNDKKSIDVDEKMRDNRGNIQLISAGVLCVLFGIYFMLKALF